MYGDVDTIHTPLHIWTPCLEAEFEIIGVKCTDSSNPFAIWNVFCGIERTQLWLQMGCLGQHRCSLPADMFTWICAALRNSDTASQHLKFDFCFVFCFVCACVWQALIVYDQHLVQKSTPIWWCLPLQCVWRVLLIFKKSLSDRTESFSKHFCTLLFWCFYEHWI